MIPADRLALAKAIPIETVIDQRGIRLRGKVERTGPCPVCGGDDRFSINIKKQVFHCRGCDKGGDVIALCQHLDDSTFAEAVASLTGSEANSAHSSKKRPNRKVAGASNGKPEGNHQGDISPKKVVVATFEYLDETGNIIFAADRLHHQNPDGTPVLKDGKPKKTFRQRRPDPENPGKWIFNVDGVPALPYRLPQLVEAIASGHPVLLVEGEAKVDLLAGWNVAATCNAGGAKHWTEDHAKHLADAHVVLVPDNDDAGWQHINVVGVSLLGIASSIKVLVLPHARPKDDIIDWAKNGGSREALDELLKNAHEWRPPQTVAKEGDLAVAAIEQQKAKADANEKELIEKLAKMRAGIEYGREREALIRKLDVRGSDLDAEVENVRSQLEDQATEPLYGHWITEPWPDLVDGDSLLRDIIARFHRHVVITEDGALVTALWIMLAWVHDEVATHSPILNIHSAEPESGKSTTMGIVSLLMPRCICSVEISEAALYRSIKKWQPSFCFDEFDNVLADDDKISLRSVINSGHTKGQGVLRCVGDDKTPELFTTFAPKAIGMIGKGLPPATLSRCIFVELRRRKRDEPIERFKHEDDQGLADLRSRLRRWSMDNVDTLRDAKPFIPEELSNRRADNWRLQLAIADLCDGIEGYGDKARAAALKIEGKSDSRTEGVRLLADIKAIFDAEPEAHCMSSATMIAKLIEDPEKPWTDYKGKALTQNRLAKLLAPYQVISQTVRTSSEKTAKGYYRNQFDDAFAYYLA
jgi:putative DNA primase/helicase